MICYWVLNTKILCAKITNVEMTSLTTNQLLPRLSHGRSSSISIPGYELLFGTQIDVAKPPLSSNFRKMCGWKTTGNYVLDHNIWMSTIGKDSFQLRDLRWGVFDFHLIKVKRKTGFLCEQMISRELFTLNIARQRQSDSHDDDSCTALAVVFVVAYM